MQQRGISFVEARQLLMRAFVGEVIDEIALEALRDRLHHLAEKRFRGELGQCGECSACH
jgi:Fe-S cluster assembly protein SufD